jgi:hypothetical protein
MATKLRTNHTENGMLPRLNYGPNGRYLAFIADRLNIADIGNQKY